MYGLSVRFASLFNPKASLWIRGRKEGVEGLLEKITGGLSEGEKLIWFHCASLGEFEQGRPFMEKFNVSPPGDQQSSETPIMGKVKVLLTFFSPSGYEVQKNYKGADFVFYLPLDTKSNARKFVEGLPLKAAFFVKYEFWYNFLRELKNKNVPTYLLSGVFRKDQYFFTFYGGWARKQLDCFTHFFLQDNASQVLLNQIGFKNTTVSGDTRFDRVAEIAEQKKDFPLIRRFTGNSKVLVAGSTWEEDEEIISTLRLKLIIAPHEVDNVHIESLEKKYARFKTLRYSLAKEGKLANEDNLQEAEVLIVDSIGMLSSLYQYATMAYVGGGFTEGIHNILEPAVYGLPVIFGPRYSKFNEASELIALGGAFCIRTSEELNSLILKFNSDPDFLRKSSEASRDYVLKRKGATAKILDAIPASGLIS